MQSLRNFRGVDHSKLFEPLLRNTRFLLKVRKFYAKFTQKRKIYRKLAKFTQNTQVLHTKNEKPCLNYANFTQITQINQKFFAFVHQNFEWSTPRQNEKNRFLRLNNSKTDKATNLGLGR